MVRTQISLTAEQHEALKRLARSRGVSMATLVREGVDIVVERDHRQARWLGALAAIEKLPGSDLADVGEKHDDYLAEAFDDWRSSPTPRRSTRSSTGATRTTSRR